MKVNSIAASLPRKVSSVEPFYSSTISAEFITLKQNWIDSQSCEISFLGLKANPWNKSVPELEIYPKTVSVSYFEADSKFILSNIETFQGVKILFRFSGIEKEFVIQPPISNLDFSYRKRRLITKLNGGMVENYYYTIKHPKFGEVYNSQGTLFSSNASYFDDKFIDFLFDELIESTELEVSVFSRSDDSLFSKYQHTLDPPGLEFFDLDIKSELIFDGKDGYIAKLEIKNFPPSINNLNGTLEYLDKNNRRMSDDVDLQNPVNQNVVSIEIPVSFHSVYDELNKFKLVFDGSKHCNLELINPNSLSISVKENIDHLDSYSNIIELDSEGEWNGKIEFSVSSSYLNPNDVDLEFNFKTKISNSLSMSLVELRENLPIIDRIFQTSKHSDISIQIKLYPYDYDKDYTDFSTTINRFELPTVKFIRNHDLAEFQNEFIFHENDELNILAFKYCAPYFSDLNFILRIGGREIKAIETNFEKDYFREIHFDISEVKYEDLYKNNRWVLMSNSGEKNILKGKIILNRVELNMPDRVKIYQRDENYIFPEIWKFEHIWETNLQYSLSLISSNHKGSQDILLYNGSIIPHVKVNLENLFEIKELSPDFVIQNDCSLELSIQSRPKIKVNLIVEESDDLLIFLMDWINEVWDGSKSVLEDHKHKDEIIVIMKNYFERLTMVQVKLFQNKNLNSKSYDLFKQIKRLFSDNFQLPKLAERMFPEETFGSEGINRAIEIHSYIEEEYYLDSFPGFRHPKIGGFTIDTLHSEHLKLSETFTKINNFILLFKEQLFRFGKKFKKLESSRIQQDSDFLLTSITEEGYYKHMKIIYEGLNQIEVKTESFYRPGQKVRFTRELDIILQLIEKQLLTLEDKFNIEIENSVVKNNRTKPKSTKPAPIPKRKNKDHPPNIFARDAAAERNKRQAARAKSKQKTNIKSSKKSIKDVDESKDIEKFAPEVNAKILDLKEKRDNALRNKLDKKAKSFQKKIDNWKNPDWVARKNRKNSVNKLKRNSRNKIQGKGDEK